MSARVSQYYHVVNTLEVYPRVYYFQKRYKDVHRRFLNIINKGPHQFLFKKSELLDDLEELRRKLETPLQICVIGRDNLEKEDLLVTTEPLQRVKADVSLFPKQEGPIAADKDQGILIFVAYSSACDIGPTGLKDVEETISHFFSGLGKTGLWPVDTLLIVCQVRSGHTVDEIDNFRTRILYNLKESFGLALTSDKIVITTNGEQLSTKISQMLEAKILEGFFLMKEHLQGFVCNKARLNMETADILEADSVKCAIQGFLKDGLGLVDILEDSKGKNIQFVDIVLRHLAQILRCSILDKLSTKVNLPKDVCNQMAFELQFEENVKRSVSKNTQHRLGKLQQPSEELIKATKESNKLYRFPGRNFTFIAYHLIADVRTVVLELEKSLIPLQNTTTVMKKMIFEIDGVLGQSTIDAGDTKKKNETVAISKELRKEIFAIDGVYGIGTIFGDFEIHVKTDEAKNMVQDKLHLFKVECPVRLRKMIGVPKLLAGRHVEHGVVLQSPFPGDEQRFRSGTLGIFVDSNSGGLYALTCAHVVKDTHDVYIQNGNGERELFGNTQPGMTVLTGDQQHPLVDIAAVKVAPLLCPNCTKFLKDDDGMMKCAGLSTEKPDELNGRYIYKYGAASHLTRGLVCSVDYSLTDEADNYLVLVSCPPGNDEAEIYAKRGDSGSINCMPNVESNKTVMAVSMLSAGDLKLEDIDDSISISFLLNTGLQKLNNYTNGVNLHVPNMDSELNILMY